MIKKLFIFFFFCSLILKAKNDVKSVLVLPEKGMLVCATLYEGDTIPSVTLSVVYCFANRVFKNQRQLAAWTRLRYNIKIVYPYAILAAAKLKEYDRILASMSNENDKKKYTKLVEKQLKDQFGDELKNLTESQGRLLIKLIDRETGKTTYDVVKSMRGSFSAFMWQGVALMFGSNLKYDYNPKGDDALIEQAILLIEDGQF